MGFQNETWEERLHKVERELAEAQDVIHDLLASELPHNPSALQPGQMQAYTDARERAQALAGGEGE